MNLIFEKDLVYKHDEPIARLINSVREGAFCDFITAITERKDWHEDLCCCYYQSGESMSYRIETSEGAFVISYGQTAEYVELGIMRYLQGCGDPEKQERILRLIQNTVFSSAEYLVDQMPPTGIPLIYGAE